MAQEEAQEQAREHKQQGTVIPLMMGMSKRHKFSIITNNIGKDEDRTPSPFIVVQLLGKRTSTNLRFYRLRRRW